LGAILLLYLFVLIAGISTAELYVLIQVGSQIGAAATIFLTVLTAMVGASLVRSQGLQTAFEVQRKMSQGQMPAGEMISGLLLVLAGIFLVMPGFITDFVGMLFLLPPLRRLLAAKILASQSIKFQTGGFGAGSTDASQSGGSTIDGECERRDDDRLN
jgi:UPF0716 protein FxsA